MSTALVRRIEWRAQAMAFDFALMAELRERMAEIPSTEDAISADDLDEMFERYCNQKGWPRRYRLPKHWHWMGS